MHKVVKTLYQQFGLKPRKCSRTALVTNRERLRADSLFQSYTEHSAPIGTWPSPPLTLETSALAPGASRQLPAANPPKALVASQDSPLQDLHINMGRKKKGRDTRSQASWSPLARPSSQTSRRTMFSHLLLPSLPTPPAITVVAGVPTSPDFASEIRSTGSGRPLSHHLAWMAKQRISAAGSSTSPAEDPEFVVNNHQQGASSGSSPSRPLTKIAISTPSQTPDAQIYPLPTVLAHAERGARWLQDQNDGPIHGIIGEVAEAIPSGASFMFGEDTSSIGDGDMRGDSPLQRGPIGRYFYNYSGAETTDQYSHRSSTESPDTSTSLPLTSDILSQGNGRPLSHHLSPIESQQIPAAGPTKSSFEDPGHAADAHHQKPPSGSASRPLTEIMISTPSQIPGGNLILPDLLPIISRKGTHSFPEELTNCSACETPLDYFRYICSVCGPESPAEKDSDTLGKGYELCSNCIYTAGVTHAHEEALTSSELSQTVVGSPLSSPEETERTIRSAVTRKAKNKWHGFIEKVWNGPGWSDIEHEDNAVCVICESAFGGGRYKCASCPQFNLCNACYTQVQEIHPSHPFLVVPIEPSTKPPPESPTEPLSQNYEELSLLHPGVTCYYCRQAIIGARFYCAICESVDICQNCEAAGLPGNLSTSAEDEHDASHVMIKIPYPLDSTEVALASSRARLSLPERVAATIEACVTPLSRPSSVGSSYAATVIASRGYLQNPSDHGIQCNSCNRNIVGTRYQCASCPSFPKAYHLCADCEKMSHVVHLKEHVFLKFNRRVNRPVTNLIPLLPLLYEESTELKEVQVPENLRSLVHSSTYCDRCMLAIRGAWFRCVYCGQDMCDEHEQLHNQDHVCMVLKAKVDLVQLRLVTDIDHPDRSAALIPAVYGFA